MRRPSIAIIGRPNVGKSTLFNRLVGRRQALVHDTPGLTRDRLQGDASLLGLEFDIVDTAGLEINLHGPLSDKLVELSMAALKQADLGLFLFDARSGLTTHDEEIAEMLRGQNKPIIVLANKCEGHLAEAHAAEGWQLGLGQPLMISAEHNEGMYELADALRQAFADAKIDATAEDKPKSDSDEDDGPLRLAIVGRPNTGKSSLVNRFLREERQLTGPIPGLTRDAVDLSWKWRGRDIHLVDTAGLRKKARVEEKLEQLANSATIRAIREAHVVLLMLDATMPLEKQDSVISNRILDEGRALVICANKWDLVEDPKETMAELKFRLAHRMSQVKEVPLITCSVLRGSGVDKLMPAIVDAHQKWSTRISTGRINRWLTAVVNDNPPPMAQNRRIKLRYATQVSSRPPTIALFSNKPDDQLPQSYIRYLTEAFRQAFDLKGTQVRFVVRHRDNPYHEAEHH